MREAILLAEKNVYAWEFSNKIKDYIKKEHGIDVPLYEVKMQEFNSGEIKPYMPDNVRRRDVYFIQDSRKEPCRWWVELMLVKNALKLASADEVRFVLPNMLWSRQDRKDQPRVPISAKVVADSISPNLSGILTMDLHAEQIQGFYPESCHVDGLYAYPVIAEYLIKNKPEILENLVVTSPDVGSAKRARKLMSFLEKSWPDGPKYGLAIVDKLRLKAGEIEDMKLVGDVNGKNCLIIDDIIDGGGTMMGACDLLRSQNAAKVYSCATHGLFSKGTDEILKKFDGVFVTDTMCQEKIPNLGVIDISHWFAEVIYREQRGESISELFNPKKII